MALPGGDANDGAPDNGGGNPDGAGDADGAGEQTGSGSIRFEGPGADKARELYDRMKEAADQELLDELDRFENGDPVVIQVVENDPEVFVGSYTGEVIDVGDILRFPEDGDGATQDGLLAHEVIEQCLGQRRSPKPVYETPRGHGAHPRATTFEDNVGGATRRYRRVVEENGTTQYEIYYERDNEDGTTTYTTTVIVFDEQGRPVVTTRDSDEEEINSTSSER